MNLLGNNIGAEQAAKLASILQASKHSHLFSLCGSKEDATELDLSGKAIRAEGSIMLAPEIGRNHPNLTKLDLSDNDIGQLASSPGETLPPNWTKAYTNGPDEDGYYTSDDGKITRQARIPGSQPLGAWALADALKSNSVLTWLNLANNNLGQLALCRGWEYEKGWTSSGWVNKSEGTTCQQREPTERAAVIALAEAVKTNTNLTTLNISNNSIGDEGKEAMGEAVREGGSIKYLTCSEWSIGPETTELDVHDKGLCSADATLLAGVLRNNEKVTKVDVLKNDIRGGGFRALQEVFEERSTLESICGASGELLDLSGKDLGVADAKIVAAELKHNSMLQSLNLSGNVELHIADALREEVCFMTSLFGSDFFYMPA